MKKTLLLLLVTFFASMGFAQQQLATLNHNDTISVFYGAAALQQAHDSATNGDIILLSSGTFNHITISKSVTIRGNGMVRDTISGTEPTIINSCNLQSNIDNFIIEGVRIASYTSFSYGAITNPLFTKCMIDFLQHGGNASMNNATFVNCIIRKFSPYQTYGFHFINSIVNITGWLFSKAFSFNNCIAYIAPDRLTISQDNVPDVTCTNSILISTNVTQGINPSASYNCLGLCYDNCNDGYFSSSSYGNQNISGLNTVFKHFSGIQSDGYLPLETDFDLQDSIATNVLGNDGTQVGVYGGMVPFTPRVNTPRYVKCNVAPHTTADGKLSVDVEVVSE